MQTRSLWGAAALALLLWFSHAPAFGQAPGAASQEELLFWDTIKNSSNPADFQEYLKQYPNGRFAGLARIRARGTAGAAPGTPSAGPRPAPAMPTGPAAFPVAGESWRYRFLDRQYSPRHPEQYEVRVLKAEGGAITETLTPLGGAPREFTLGVAELAFQPRSLPHTKVAMEFAPYWIWREPPMASPLRLRSGSGYPLDRNTADWQVVITSAPSQVTVPAGIFGNAIKVELKGTRQISQELTRRGETGRFQVTAWYAREAGRVVKIEHRAWSAGGNPAGDEVIELLEHKVSAATAALEPPKH